MILVTVAFANGAFSECRAQRDAVKPSTRSAQYEKKKFTSRDGTNLAYWLMSPQEIDPEKKYPLVLALHGRGGNTEAATVLASAEMRKKYPCFVIAPAVSRKEVWAATEDPQGPPRTQRITIVMEAIGAAMKAHPVDPSRVYVTGQSMGGYGTFGAIAESPRTFAAAMPVCGGWNPDDAVKMKDVPIWVFHGDADRTVPVERSRKMVEAIQRSGSQVKYTEYPGVGHNSWSKTYASPEVWNWLFAQRRSDDEATTDDPGAKSNENQTP